MTREAWRYIFTATIAMITVGLAGVSVWLWPTLSYTDQLWMLPTLALMIALAGRFPFKVSPQGDATFVTVPLFMAVLLLHPLEAVLVGIVGVLASESMLKAPARAFAFNVSANGLIAGLAGIVFWSLQPDATGNLFDPGVALAAAVAGLVVFITDKSLLLVMITLVKGRAFWRRWMESWTYEAVLDGSMLVLGLMGALLVTSAWWTLVVFVVPPLVAYYAFSRSVNEVVQKTQLAEELDNNLRELKETQAQLIQSAKLASVGTLAAGIAHDINNPLTVITGRAEIIQGKLRKPKEDLDIEKISAGIEDMYGMAMRISSIVNQLLSYSRRSEELSSPERLDRLIDDALPLLERKFAKKNVELVRKYEETPMVNVVAGQLHQVFMNLVGNALDAMPEWGTITLGCTIENGMATAYVKDTGSGIPQEVLDRIFEPFFTTKEVGQGTGLGLFICHKIVTDHQGELSVESEPGQGTTFWVKLPAVAAAMEESSPSPAFVEL